MPTPSAVATGTPVQVPMFMVPQYGGGGASMMQPGTGMVQSGMMQPGTRMVQPGMMQPGIGMMQPGMVPTAQVSLKSSPRLLAHYVMF